MDKVQNKEDYVNESCHCVKYSFSEFLFQIFEHYGNSAARIIYGTCVKNLIII